MVNEEVFVSVFSALGDTWVKPYQVLLYYTPNTLFYVNEFQMFKCFIDYEISFKVRSTLRLLVANLLKLLFNKDDDS